MMAVGVTEQAELPRSIRRGPPITLTCDCGELRRQIRYGETWRCEKCGRNWNTNRIPVEQYAAIRKTQMRYRRVPIALSVFALVTVILSVIFGRAVGGLLVAGVMATTWNMFFRPIHRRKYREALATLPSWRIESE
jgi:hypothetical protein